MIKEYRQTEFVLNLSCVVPRDSRNTMIEKGNIGAGNEARTRDLNLGKIASQRAHRIDEYGKAAFWQCSRKRNNPWSARPRLFALPHRLSADRRREHLREIEARCTKTPAGCWLYLAVRDEGYPYIDLVGDDGRREQWSARRYAWALAKGDIPDGGIILGACPPKACVLPEHQWLWVPPRQLELLSAPDSTERRCAP
jgi:hypothetical protein